MILGRSSLRIPLAKFALFALTGTLLISHGRESRACQPPPYWPSVTLVGAIPKDGVIPIYVPSTANSSFQYEVSDAGGSAVPVALESSSAEYRILRPTAGEFPVGALHIVLRAAPPGGSQVQAFPYDFVVSNERMADATYHLTNPKVEALRIPDTSSPKIVCHRSPVYGCGESSSDLEETQEIHSRAKKVAAFSFETEAPSWATYLMLPTFKYTVRRSDGSILEEPARGYGHSFDSTGVEYCAEVTFTPRYGTSPAKTARACAPNGDLRYDDVTQDDHDAVVVGGAQSLQCKSLDFPRDVPVPAAVADKSSGGQRDGCSAAPHGARGTNTAAGLLVGLGAACVLWRRRRRPG